MGERRRRARCHTPDKDHYRYQPEAERAAREAAKHYGYAMEAYECPTCGAWHITKVKPPPRGVGSRTTRARR